MFVFFNLCLDRLVYPCGVSKHRNSVWYVVFFFCELWRNIRTELKTDLSKVKLVRPRGCVVHLFHACYGPFIFIVCVRLKEYFGNRVECYQPNGSSKSKNAACQNEMSGSIKAEKKCICNWHYTYNTKNTICNDFHERHIVHGPCRIRTMNRAWSIWRCPQYEKHTCKMRKAHPTRPAKSHSLFRVFTIDNPQKNEFQSI